MCVCFFAPQLLVNVFGKQLQEDKHPHLRNFYAIVPPLTVNYVEHMIAAKEKISKNNFNGAAFTDDGLPMGKLVLSTALLKVRYFRKQIFLLSFEPKNKQNYSLISAQASKNGSNKEK